MTKAHVEAGICGFITDIIANSVISDFYYRRIKSPALIDANLMFPINNTFYSIVYLKSAHIYNDGKIELEFRGDTG